MKVLNFLDNLTLRNIVSVYMIGLLLCLLVSGLVGVVLWGYILVTWSVYLGHAINFTNWTCFLLGVIPGIGQLSVPIALVTYLLFAIVL